MPLLHVRQQRLTGKGCCNKTKSNNVKKKAIPHIHIDTLKTYNDLLSFPKPRNPLFSIQRFEDFPLLPADGPIKLTMDFYQITFKKNCGNKIIYGQSLYDFDEGVLSFFSPKQVVIKEPDQISNTGFIILIHPEYIRGHALETKIKSYGFFDYAVNEALILSAEEEDFIQHIFIQLEKEFNRAIDHLSQDVILSNLDLLLTYSNRYYTRQFITRKQHYNSLLAKFETLLDELFAETTLAEKGLPNVADIAAAFHLSSRYFSDLIKEHTGRTTQQHIHDKLIDKAKEMLSATNLSVSEIAYQLGFQHSQSFSKLFKAKTDQSPLAFRAGFN